MRVVGSLMVTFVLVRVAKVPKVYKCVSLFIQLVDST